MLRQCCFTSSKSSCRQEQTAPKSRPKPPQTAVPPTPALQPLGVLASGQRAKTERDAGRESQREELTPSSYADAQRWPRTQPPFPQPLPIPFLPLQRCPKHQCPPWQQKLSLARGPSPVQLPCLHLACLSEPVIDPVQPPDPPLLPCTPCIGTLPCCAHRSMSSHTPCIDAFPCRAHRSILPRTPCIGS
eukprot:3666640-Rhodomonas_salina.1